VRTAALCSLVLLAFLQSSTLLRIPLLGVTPDLVFLGVVAWTIVRGLREGAIAAFTGGLTLDLLSPGWLGSHALALLLVAALVAVVTAPLHRGNLLFPVLTALLGTIGYHLLLMALTGLLGRSGGLLALRVVLPLALVHGALMPLAYAASEGLDRRIRPRMRFG